MIVLHKGVIMRIDVGEQVRVTRGILRGGAFDAREFAVIHRASAERMGLIEQGVISSRGFDEAVRLVAKMPVAS